MSKAPDGEATRIAQALIRCPSVTPQDAGALQYLATLLAEAGFHVERPVFSEPDTPDVDNLYARIGAGHPCLVFAGHTDVVPPGELRLWSRPPFSGDIVDGRLFGRGAADMKGGVAASVAAAIQHVRAHGVPPSGSIAILLTGDEEGPAINGTVKLLDWARARGEVFDHCVLGEPTNPSRLGEMMKIGRRGSLSGRIEVRGRQGHVAYPHLVVNPVPHIARLILGLETTPLDAGSASFDASSLQVTSVDVGNPSTNVVPASASARFNVRFNDLWTPETLAAELRSRLETTATAHGIVFELVVAPTNAVAFLAEQGPFIDLVSRAITTETGLEPVRSTSGGTSDARFIKSHCDVVEFGLVGETMHQIDEHVAVADIEALTRIYRDILAAYFAEFAV